jgi:nucleotide-binding universal stress UspA family protein
MEKQPTEREFNVILAVDGSVHSWAAVNLIRDLNLEQVPHARLAVVTVLIPRNASDYASREMLLENTQKLLAEEGVSVSIELLTGYPAEMLTQYGEEHHPDLMVMGARGLRSTLGILLGGVAQQMVEVARWPVLIVRAPYKGLHRILLVTDGSEQSCSAIEFLTRFPRPAGCEIKVLHVLPPYELPEMILQADPLAPGPIVPVNPPLPEKPAIDQQQEEKVGQDIVTNTHQFLLENGIETGCVLLRGDAATEIIDYAKTNDVDLIVSGSRGLGMFRSWLLGSVSRKIVHYGPCSVLVVKGG